MEMTKEYTYSSGYETIDNEIDFKCKFNEEWVSYFMNIARVVATKSKDPSTKVGCVVVDTATKRIMATGYNGFPPGVNEDKSRWERPTKYDFVTHAEQNCIAAAARFGICLTGATMFVTLHPCVDCAKLIASAGISNIVFIESELERKQDRDWITHLENAKAIFRESNITLIAVTEVKPIVEAPPPQPLSFKGSVATVDDLNAIDPMIGDVFYVNSEDTEYVYWLGKWGLLYETFKDPNRFPYKQ